MFWNRNRFWNFLKVFWYKPCMILRTKIKLVLHSELAVQCFLAYFNLFSTKYVFLVIQMIITLCLFFGSSHLLKFSTIKLQIFILNQISLTEPRYSLTGMQLTLNCFRVWLPTVKSLNTRCLKTFPGKLKWNVFTRVCSMNKFSKSIV